jgi:prepilin-type N-terminal cleavage/methylation domain-containing protein
MKIKKIRNINQGFTLLEIIVAIFIIALLAGIFLANYHGGNQSNDLTFAAQKIVSDIRTAQNNSLGSVPYGGYLPVGGWGIHFDTTVNSYLLFADVNNNKVYDADEAVTASGGLTFTLPANVVINNITGDNLTSDNSHTKLDITFLPPNPTTRIYWGPAASSSYAVIVLKHNITGKTADVNVNILGLIEAQ